MKTLPLLKVIVGVGAIGGLAGGTYIWQDMMKPKTIGAELYSEDVRNKLLEDTSEKWATRLQKHKNTSESSPVKIEGVTETSSDTSENNLRNKCKELWEYSNDKEDSQKRKKELKDWCLENSAIDS